MGLCPEPAVITVWLEALWAIIDSMPVIITWAPRNLFSSERAASSDDATSAEGEGREG